ncbi:ParA family protein [Aliarcobacter butzleri]|uniref:ParA family protein n=1 Tax=Aliarcobacter butzleri TaxID=28197 RepID=UPI00344CC8B4
MLIALEHQKGGVGKSTITWNLAIELSKKLNKKIEVVDLDVQQTLTLNNYTRNKEGLSALDIRTFKDIDSLKKYIETDNNDKLMIIDTGGFDSGLNRLIGLVADFIITPVSDSTVELQGLKTFEKVLKDLNKSSNEKIISHVLLNSIDPRKKDLEDLKKFINTSDNFKLLESVIRRRTDFKESISFGKSVIEYKKDSKAASEIEALANEVIYLLDI